MSKSEGQVLDFEKICRLCLLEKRSMSSIFSKKKSDKKVPLPVRIMSCASLELYEGDGLPASICSKCLLSVNQSYAFREQCEQADTTLRQYAQRMNEASGETSSNRESRERIAQGSLEHIEDNGIKFEEGQVRGPRNNDEDHNRSNSLELNCEKVAISSGDFAANPEEPKGLTLRKAENLIKCTVKYWEGIGCTEGEENNASIKNVNCSKLSGEFNYSKGSIKGCEINGKMKKKGAEILQSPVLRALSEKKSENVVVIADVPDVCEGEDGDVDEIFSKGHHSLPKTRSRKLFRSKMKKSVLSFQSLDEEKFAKENSVGCENEKLLQSLMKNKNIVVRKRVSTDGTPSLEHPPEKVSTLKSQAFDMKLCRQKSFLFPHDFKIAQLWREWEEVNNSIPELLQKTTRTNPDVRESGNEVASVVEESSQEAKDHIANDVEKKYSDEPVPKVNAEGQKSGDGPRTKWKNARDTVYCKECRIFLMRSSFNNHIKFVHKKIRKYLCQTCGYAAYTGTILRQHVQAVHVGYSFFCDQCPKKFNLMKRLRKHMESQHSGKPIPRNHICQYCGMTFSKPGCLTRHLRSHTQETPYQCQYCQRRFKYRWPKVQHERLHTGEKPYKCSFCEERFTQNCVRKAHEYKKHGNQEFKPKTRVKEEAVVVVEKENSEASSRGSYNSGLESG